MERGNAIVDFDEDALVTAMSVQMRVEIVSYNGDVLKGILYSHFLDAPYEFTNLLQVIEKMEDVFDSKGFPEAFMTPRVFGASAHGKKNHEMSRNINMKDLVGTIAQPEPSGAKCTFEISVKFRQNATWQGQILWAEKNLKQNFRSVLEMLKLMDEALADSEEKVEQVKWDS